VARITAAGDIATNNAWRTITTSVTAAAALDAARAILANLDKSQSERDVLSATAAAAVTEVTWVSRADTIGVKDAEVAKVSSTGAKATAVTKWMNPKRKATATEKATTLAKVREAAEATVRKEYVPTATTFSHQGAAACSATPVDNPPPTTFPSSVWKNTGSADYWEIDLGDVRMVTQVRIVGLKGYGDSVDVAAGNPARLKGIRVSVLETTSDVPTDGTCTVAPTAIWPIITPMPTDVEKSIISPMILAGLNPMVAIKIYRQLQIRPIPTDGIDLVALGLSDSKAAAAWVKIKHANLSTAKNPGKLIIKHPYISLEESATSAAIITPSITGTVRLTLKPNLKYDFTGIPVLVTGDTTVNNFKGVVSAYNPGTGIATIGTMTNINGTFGDSVVYNISWRNLCPKQEDGQSEWKRAGLVPADTILPPTPDITINDGYCYYCPTGTTVDTDKTYCNNNERLSQEDYDEGISAIKSITNMLQVIPNINRQTVLQTFLSDNSRTFTDGTPPDNGSRSALHMIMGMSGLKSSDPSSAYSAYSVADEGINTPPSTQSWSRSLMLNITPVVSSPIPPPTQTAIIVNPSTTPRQIAVKIPAVANVAPIWGGAGRIPTRSVIDAAAVAASSSFSSPSDTGTTFNQPQWYVIKSGIDRGENANSWCASYQGKLATLAQVRDAHRHGASACFGGFVEDDRVNKWLPSRGTNCNTTSGVYSSPIGADNGANCYGPRPPIGEPNIAPWTDTAGLVINNYYTEGDWSKRMNGDGGILKLRDNITNAKPGTPLRSQELFWIGTPGQLNNFRTYQEGNSVCSSAGGIAASLNDLIEAQKRGAHWPDFGWIRGEDEFQYHPWQVTKQSANPPTLCSEQAAAARAAVAARAAAVGWAVVAAAAVETAAVAAAAACALTGGAAARAEAKKANDAKIIVRQSLRDGSAGFICKGIKPSLDTKAIELPTNDLIQTVPVNMLGRYVRVQAQLGTWLHFSQIVVTNDLGQNVAFRKNTYATDTLGGGGGPSLAVDGNLSARDYPTIWHSEAIGTDDDTSYWQVDLGAVHKIVSITYYGRKDCCTDRILGTRFKISYFPSVVVPFSSGIFQGISYWSQNTYLDTAHCPPGTRALDCIKDRPSSCIPSDLQCAQSGICPTRTVYNTQFMVCLPDKYIDGSGSSGHPGYFPGQGWGTVEVVDSGMDNMGPPYTHFNGECIAPNCISSFFWGTVHVAQFNNDRVLYSQYRDFLSWIRWNGKPAGSTCTLDSDCAPIIGSDAEEGHNTPINRTNTTQQNRCGGWCQWTNTVSNLPNPGYETCTGYCESGICAASEENISRATAMNTKCRDLADKATESVTDTYDAAISIGNMEFNKAISNPTNILLSTNKSSSENWMG